MFINSICPTCKKQYNCPVIKENIVCDDVTVYVIDCDMYDYSEESEDYL